MYVIHLEKRNANKEDVVFPQTVLMLPSVCVVGVRSLGKWGWLSFLGMVVLIPAHMLKLISKTLNPQLFPAYV